MYQRASYVTAIALMAAPLAADWQEYWQPPLGYNPSFLGDWINRIYLEADYLLWYANQDGNCLSYHYDQTLPLNSSIVTATQNGNFFRTKWSSGVRGVIGFKPAERFWDVRGVYTFFSSSICRSEGPASLEMITTGSIQGSFVGPLYYPGVNAGPFTQLISQIDTKWELHFNQFDIEVGREFFVSKDLTIRPVFGIRGLWVDQKFSTVNNLAIYGSFPYSFVAIFDPSSRFNGFGTKGGFDASIHLFSGLDLYGHLAASILWGNARVKQPLAESVSSSSEIFLFYDTANHSHHMSILNFDLGIGVRWNQWVQAGRHLLTLKFGWEQHLFTNMNQLQNVIFGIGLLNPNFEVDSNIYRGDLSLSGFIFSIGYLY